MRNAMLIVLLMLLAPLAWAEVTDSAANGFTTVNEVIIADGRTESWVAAVDQIDAVNFAVMEIFQETTVG